MSREPEQAFFQRQTDSQQTHEEMFNFTNQGNVNQNHNELSLHTYQNRQDQKSQQSVGKDVEKRKPLYTASRNINWCRHWKMISPKIKDRAIIRSSYPTPCYLSREYKDTNPRRIQRHNTKYKEYKDTNLTGVPPCSSRHYL